MESNPTNPYEAANRCLKALSLVEVLRLGHISADDAMELDESKWKLIAMLAMVTPQSHPQAPSPETRGLVIDTLRKYEVIAKKLFSTVVAKQILGNVPIGKVEDSEPKQRVKQAKQAKRVKSKKRQ